MTSCLVSVLPKRIPGKASKCYILTLPCQKLAIRCISYHNHKENCNPTWSNTSGIVQVTTILSRKFTALHFCYRRASIIIVRIHPGYWRCSRPSDLYQESLPKSKNPLLQSAFLEGRVSLHPNSKNPEILRPGTTWTSFWTRKVKCTGTLKHLNIISSF